MRSMTRSWLVRLAAFLIAALCLATPQVATAAEPVAPIRPAGVAPRVDWCAHVPVVRTATRDEQDLVHSACCSPAAAFRLAPVLHENARRSVERASPLAAFRALQPPARAPPPRS